MPFKQILTPLLENGQGIYSAIIADWEGEAVDCLSPRGEIEDLKIFGAHQGILLSHFRRCLDESRCGAIREIHIRAERVDWFVFPITSEYYLALCVEPDQISSRISMEAQQCVVQLREEFDV
jgi:predicted regulator of Ras-like GTPase activity (Roadblock/LC7/MglB family)